MVDARMPERYLMDRRVARLNDSEFRSFVTATLWSVSNRTDGHLTADDLTLIPRFVTSAALKLVELELWADEESGWVICDFASTQTSRDELTVLENARRRDREKKSRQRAEKKVGPGGPSFTEGVPGDIPGDVSPRTAQAGQARNNGREEEEFPASIPPNELQESALRSWDIGPGGKRVS